MTTQHDERAELIRKAEACGANHGQLMRPWIPKDGEAYEMKSGFGFTYEELQKFAALLAADARAGGQAVVRLVVPESRTGLITGTTEAAHRLPPGEYLCYTQPQPPAQDIDWLPHDDTLRFVQRVLESDAPKADRNSAAKMVRDMRLSIRPAAAQVAQPLTELLAAADDVCKTLEHPTHSVNAIQMWRLRDALTAHGIGKDQA